MFKLFSVPLNQVLREIKRCRTMTVEQVIARLQQHANSQAD
jgi:hypothetical protein